MTIHRLFLVPRSMTSVITRCAFLLVFLMAVPAWAERLTIKTRNGNIIHLEVDVARTSSERARGLMYRTELGDREGMLFDYRPSREVRMWMKNTLIPLDMLFMDENGTIVHVEREAKPHSLEARGPDRPVTGVLEMRGGLTAELGVDVGDRVVHPMFGY